ncbi:MAG: serine/threonine-protein kinase [Archangium sp.]|nr:serine/threonine-protein kinase [Archangium sp.]
MAAPQHLPPGTLIAGKYELEGLLGEGGMGAVYQATNLSIGRRVAIKILHAAVADREDVRRRFEMEARAAAVISHPGIVDVLDMGQTDEGEPFIVMEHLEGMTLRSLNKEFKGLTPEQSVGVMLPVLDALGAAHRAGVIHRDVKPANIFVCAKPQVVKLLDFGVSRFGASSGLTNTGTAVGTPRYMAPEQVLGEADLGPEADLYSVGAVLYSLLSGRLPHGSGSDMALLARTLHDTPAPLASITTGLPPALCELVDSLLLKDRARRPKDAAAVKEALQQCVPATDLAVLYNAAIRTARASALAPTPSRSNASLPGVPSKKATPSAPRPPPNAAPTRTAVVAPPGSKPGLFIAVTVLALALGGGGAVWYLKSQPRPVVVAPPVAPAPITVTLKAEPAGARIKAGGTALTCNPCELTGALGTKQQVKVTAEGMAEATLDVTFDEDRTQKVVLVAAPVAATPEPAMDAGRPASPAKKKKKTPRGLSVDEKNPYQ